MRYKDLSALEDKDLELMGIKNETVRAQMIQHFARLPNQEAGFDNILKTTDIFEYSATVLNNISEHIYNLKSSLVAPKCRMNMSTPEDVLIIDENILGSELVLKTIDKMMCQCDEMRVLVDEVVGDWVPEKEKSGILTKFWKSGMWIGAIALATYAAQKVIRTKLLVK